MVKEFTRAAERFSLRNRKILRTLVSAWKEIDLIRHYDLGVLGFIDECLVCGHVTDFS